MAKKRGRKPTQRNLPANRQASPQRRAPEAQVPSVVTSIGVTKLHQGPLPDAQTLAEYELAWPGTAERIIRMAEKPLEMAQEQQSHRIKLETKVIASDIRRSWAGLVLGALIVVGVITVGVVLTVKGRTTVGLTAMLAPLGVLAGNFIYTDQRKRQERRDVADRSLGY